MTYPSTVSALLACVLAANHAAAQTAAPGHRDRTPVPFSRDCNGNGVPDAADLASGLSEDCDGNLVPDECDLTGSLLFSESFEGGPPAGWTFTGQWHVTNDCSRPSDCSGTRFAYFGGDSFCDFETGSEMGEMILPLLDLPVEPETLVLTYCSAYQGEGQDFYDVADVVVNGTVVDIASPEEHLDWETRWVSLTAYAGQTVDIRFRFDAMDGLGNEYLGWQVDKVEVMAYQPGSVVDCNANGLIDVCEIASGVGVDCNGNGLPDECDLATGFSPDCQGNGIPDECDVAGGAFPDCNGNFVPDECDLATGFSQDCQGNDIPDECDIASGALPDCNGNLVPDVCDLAAGFSRDCQGNGIPDECDVASGAFPDCNGNLVPDVCDLGNFEDAVTALAERHETITGFFPDTFEFEGGESGVCIADGGMNMFDCGNVLRTDISLAFYTNGQVVSQGFFGAGASWFTTKQPGLFVLGAIDLGIDSFEIGGSNGSGSPAAAVDTLELSVTVGGAPYKLYVKRVHGGPQPSVNQMIIVPGDGAGLTHSFASDPDLCFQKLEGLTGTERLYYVLVSRFSGTEGLPLRPVDAQEIAREVIAAFPSLDDNGNDIPDECE